MNYSLLNLIRIILQYFYKKYNGFNGEFWGSDYSVIFDDTDPYFLTYSGYNNQTIDGRILDKNNNYVMHARTCIPLPSKIIAT